MHKKNYFSFRRLAAFCIFGLGLLQGTTALATVTKSITMTVSEKSVSDALALALRMAAKKYVNLDPAIQKPIMDSEVIPHSSQYISSYKVVSGGGGKNWVNVNATIDLNALQSILVLNGSQFKKSPVKLLLLVRGFKGGAPWKGIAYEDSEALLVERVEREVRERTARRKITLMPRINAFQEHIENIEANSTSMLRAIALRTDADLVLFVDTKFVESNDDESIIEGLQLELVTALYERSQNLILANSKASMQMAAGERAITSKSEKVMEAIGELIDKATHDVWMRGGARYLAETSSETYLTLRILDPPNYAAITEFKEAVQKISRVNAVIEREIERGHFDFWVDAGFGYDTLKRELRAMQLDNFRISVRQPTEGMEKDIALVRIESKPKAAAAPVEVENDKKKR